MRIVLIYSGGLDSTVLLYQLLSQGHEVRCLSINYGQRHAKELACAENICKLLDVGHYTLDLSSMLPLLGGNSQTDPTVEVPEGHFEDEAMKTTVVPNRNMVMLACAASWAVSTKSEYVAYAAHAGDHAIYPDCRTDFVEAMRGVIGKCDWHVVGLLTPFLRLSKTGIVETGIELGVPFERTWTCYKGLEEPCGKCAACVERAEAFKLAGCADPL